jgi:hypothetical protein
MIRNQYAAPSIALWLCLFVLCGRTSRITCSPRASLLGPFEQRVTAKDTSVKDSTERLFEFDGVLDDKMGQPALFEQVRGVV